MCDANALNQRGMQGDMGAEFRDAFVGLERDYKWFVDAYFAWVASEYLCNSLAQAPVAASDSFDRPSKRQKLEEKAKTAVAERRNRANKVQEKSRMAQGESNVQAELTVLKTRFQGVTHGKSSLSGKKRERGSTDLNPGVNLGLSRDPTVELEEDMPRENRARRATRDRVSKSNKGNDMPMQAAGESVPEVPEATRKPGPRIEHPLRTTVRAVRRGKDMEVKAQLPETDNNDGDKDTTASTQEAAPKDIPPPYLKTYVAEGWSPVPPPAEAGSDYGHSVRSSSLVVDVHG